MGSFSNPDVLFATALVSQEVQNYSETDVDLQLIGCFFLQLENQIRRE